ncbi:hypothetical protein [Pseudomonas sp. Irchel s3b5]|uniref:hypothetical protein n=1 Tax=Pseudomonas sp. Irchel s3b5 TaxID=2009077 RepID=UPI00117B8DFF|nr:hypothetical protein [Pseudomonas sp. Irchel s3b5]
MKKLVLMLALLAPLNAYAAEPDHRAICKDLRSDIAHRYDVYNLVLVEDGSSYVSEEGLVLCVYDGIVKKFYGERAIRVMATLNAADNKLNVLL